jgi:hypothetical protein
MISRHLAHHSHGTDSQSWGYEANGGCCCYYSTFENEFGVFCNRLPCVFNAFDHVLDNILDCVANLLENTFLLVIFIIDDTSGFDDFPRELRADGVQVVRVLGLDVGANIGGCREDDCFGCFEDGGGYGGWW